MIKHDLFKEPPWLEAFERDLVALCEKHGVVLSHEDGHGSGIVARVPGDAGLDIALTTRCTCVTGWDHEARSTVVVSADPECQRHGEPAPKIEFLETNSKAWAAFERETKEVDAEIARALNAPLIMTARVHWYTRTGVRCDFLNTPSWFWIVDRGTWSELCAALAARGAVEAWCEP